MKAYKEQIMEALDQMPGKINQTIENSMDGIKKLNEEYAEKLGKITGLYEPVRLARVIMGLTVWN